MSASGCVGSNCGGFPQTVNCYDLCKCISVKSPDKSIRIVKKDCLWTIEIDKSRFSSTTYIEAGDGISVDGSGSLIDPYVISSTFVPDGSETKIQAGTNISVTGTGTTLDPYIIDNTLTVPVTSVNGLTGDVVLTTTEITEGTNLYYTDTRVRNALSAGTGISYNSLTGVISADSVYLDSLYFKPGGNSFGTTATLGTNDNYGLNFETNGTTKISILNGGGTSVTFNPNSAFNGIIYLNSGVGYGSSLEFQNNGVQQWAVNGSTTGFSIRRSSADQFNIFSGGNVGIGVNGVNAGYKLDVNGTGRFTGVLASTGGLSVLTGGLAANVLNGNTNLLNANTNTIAGRLELSGSANQSTMLDITATPVANSAYTLQYFRANNYVRNAAGSLNDYIVRMQPTYDYSAGTHNVTGLYYAPTLTNVSGLANHRALHLVTGDVLLCQTSGNVGIGVNSVNAGYKLDVNGTVRTAATIYTTITSDNTSPVFYKMTNNGAGIGTGAAIEWPFGQRIVASFLPNGFAFYDKNQVDNVSFSASGMSFSLSSVIRTTVNNGVLGLSAETGASARVDITGAGGIRLYTYSGSFLERVRLTSLGNLLINTTTDAGYKLDVNGTLRFGTYLQQSVIRGSLNFDNATVGNDAYIMQGGVLNRSIKIPGTGGNAPWIINNTGSNGIQVKDYTAGNSISLKPGNNNGIQIVADFSSPAYILGAEHVSDYDLNFVFGNGQNLYSNRPGYNLKIKSGTGGVTGNQPGGDIYLTAGAGGGTGRTGYIIVNHTPEYADNAAALAASLPIGTLYRTGDILKIVH